MMRALHCLLLLAITLAACARWNGYDESRFETPAPSASVDPEREPLPSTPRARMIDPRSPLPDAGSPPKREASN